MNLNYNPWKIKFSSFLSLLYICIYWGVGGGGHHVNFNRKLLHLVCDALENAHCAD